MIADLKTFEVWGPKSFSAYQGPRGGQKKTEYVNPLNTTVNVRTVQCILQCVHTRFVEKTGITKPSINKNQGFVFGTIRNILVKSETGPFSKTESRTGPCSDAGSGSGSRIRFRSYSEPGAWPSGKDSYDFGKIHEHRTITQRSGTVQISLRIRYYLVLEE